MSPLVCPDCELLARRDAELEKENQALHQQNLVLLKRLEKLEARLDIYENAHTPSSKKLFPERKPRDEPSGRLGRPPGYEGSTRATPKPDKQIVVLKEKCDACGTPLSEPAGFSTRVIEEIPEPRPVQVVEYKLGFYVCPHCGKQNVAEHEDCPREGVLGHRALSQVALLKYEGRLPCKLVCTALERDYGLRITPATVLAVNARVANGLQNEYNAILQRVRLAPILYVDETSFRVGGVNYWLWAFTTPTETLAVIRSSRGKKVLREILNDFAGIIVCDGWKTYSNFTNRLQRCWAHLLREAKYVAEFEEEAVPLLAALRKMYAQLVKELSANPSFEKRLWLFRNARQALRYWLSKHWKTMRVRKFVEKIRNGFKHWFTFVLIPGVEPTNNRAERALREHVVIRKIIGTLRNEKGVHAHEVITSVLTSWRQQAATENTDLRERLVDALRAKAS